MSKLTASQRKKLKSDAHHLNPLVIVGQKGLSKTLIASVEDALKAHELIKIKFNDFKEEKEELSNKIADETGSEIVSIIGNIVILYRKNEK